MSLRPRDPSRADAVLPTRLLRSCLKAGLVMALALGGPGFAAAATGTIAGLVRDADSHEELIGVDLVLVGAGVKGATDIEGRFEFTDLPVGGYELRLTYLGYNTKFLTGLTVESGRTLELTIDLESFKAFETDDVVVSAARILSTESALLADRKSAAVIGDAISAAQIGRTPDGTSGDALKRVPGLTVTGGKYVYVRGVTDRYNVTEVNGISLSGANVDRDRKSFNFDMVPSNLLANVVVIKSATPDMPGDFSGGLVRINTLEFPEKSTTAVGFSAAHTEGTTGKAFFYEPDQGSRDWLGIDDGLREFPTDDSGERLTGNDLARALPNRWVFEERNAPLRMSMNLSHGNRIAVPGGDLGYMAALSYRNKYNQEDGIEQRKSDPAYGGRDKFGAILASHKQVLWGGLANAYYRFGQGHRIGLTNNYNRSADNTITLLTDGDDSDKSFTWRTLEWQERYQFTNKLDGVHPLGVRGLELAWRGYYGESHAVEPDRRYLEYNVNDPENPIMDENMRTWSWLKEFRRGAGADLTWSLARDELDREYAGEFKIGFLTEERVRDFEMGAWYSNYTFAYQSFALGLLPPEEIFAPENYNPTYENRGHAFNFETDRFNSGRYVGRNDLTAFYAMADVPFAFLDEDFRLTGGVRRENSVQDVIAWEDKLVDRPDSARVDTHDLLPSANLTWQYDQRTNVRLGYYESVNRPEFRELAPVNRRNFKTFQNEIGNPDLKRARVRNYDLRFEFFPDYGEVFAVSLFYKRFQDAIEEKVFPSPERAVLSWTNSDRGKNYGYELETRYKLDAIGFLEDFTVTANFTRVWSEVDYLDLFDSTEKTRPLQGQAPWSLNAGLQYDNPNTGTSVNLLFNKIGRSLDTVGDSAITNVYLEPQDRLDVVVSQEIARGLKIKAAAKDVLGRDQVRTSGPDAQPYDYSIIGGGSEYSLATSYRF
ncbi:outer membrane beta-barrel protein [bacterium]|nr:outer membrane beta-barrel protein [bacterium]